MPTATATAISLEGDCHYSCGKFSVPLFTQLATGRYDECSVQPLRFERDWLEAHRTARKRSARATRLGYEFGLIARHEYADDIFAINTSARERQGRPMSAGYWAAPSRTPDPGYDCFRHGVHPYGVRDDRGTLVAYLWCYRAGELALVSQILGHADHLANDVMFLLFHGAMREEFRNGRGWFVYNRADSGQAGLKFFKARLGFEPMEVEWQL